MKNEIEELSKIVLRQVKLLSILSECLLDQAVIIESLLPKCDKCNVRIATVTHVIHGEACERCAAEISCHSDQPFSFSSSRDMLVDDSVNDWIDKDHAEKVRRLLDFVANVNALRSEDKTGDIH